MELDEIKKLRREIRKHIEETLLDKDKSDKALYTKENLPELKKTCVTELVDLKNEFENSNEEPDHEKTLKNIEKAISSLNKIKKSLSNQL